MVIVAVQFNYVNDTEGKINIFDSISKLENAHITLFDPFVIKVKLCTSHTFQY